MTSALGVSALGSRPLAGTWARAKPSASITSPSGTINEVVASWTYSSPVGRAQYSYRIQVRSADGSTILYDTLTVISSDDSDIAVDYQFSGGSSYQLWVRVSDLFDTSEWATSSFTADLVDVNDFPTEPLVGSIYEIGINGMGLMLEDNPQSPVRRRLQVLQAPRLATGDTPFSEAVERYTFLGQNSFKGGAGQTYTSRPDSDPTRYLDSQSINPFDDEGVQLLPAVAQANADDYATPFMVVVGSRHYSVTDDGELRAETSGGTGTTFSITGAAAPTSLATDGTYWYYADGANIFRNNTFADPVTAWSTINGLIVRSCLDRIVCTYDNGAGEIVVSTLGADGAEEVASGRFLYPDTADIPDLAAGDGYLWFIVNRANQSQIHFWQVGSAEDYAAVGLTLPHGQRAVALGFYLGNLFVRAVQDTSDGTARKAFIYRCVPQDGTLTPELVVEWENAADNTVGEFAGNERFVFFSWSLPHAGRYGTGCIDLSTGGYAKWITTSATGPVRSLGVLDGRIVMTLDANGTYIEDTALETTGFLTTSISDLNSGLTKVFDEIRAVFDPLPASGTVAIEYTLDGGTSYTALDANADTAGQQLLSEAFGVEGRSIGLKITLGASATSPLLRHVQTKLHALSLSDHLMQFPVKCADNMAGLNGRPLPTNAPGGGMNLIRTLESLIGTRVKLQDVDWAINNTTTIWELVDVDTVLTSTFNAKSNRNVTSGVATITLRRSV